jgi:hypothetical protein
MQLTTNLNSLEALVATRIQILDYLDLASEPVSAHCSDIVHKNLHIITDVPQGYIDGLHQYSLVQCQSRKAHQN